MHPDKVEPEQKEEAEGKYVEITKAYKALTDDDARKNWEEFGHPDGKQCGFERWLLCCKVPSA